MNEDQIADLKQFIAQVVSSEVSGAVSSLGKRLDNVESRLDSVEKEVKQVRQGLEDVNTKLDVMVNAAGEDIEELQNTSSNHEVRIRKLEAKAA